MLIKWTLLLLVVALWATASSAAAQDDFESGIEHGFADHDGVRIHFVRAGQGPLVVMLHGFPDYWYTWRHQIEALSEDHTVVAMDLRGYNKSDQPEGVAAYAMQELIGDVVAVIRAQGRDRATIVGHDWGAAIAWQFAMFVPDMTERLVILSVPHPSGFLREMASNAEQQENSQYARNFQEEGAHESLTAEGLAAWVTDEGARARYVEAFRRSSFEGMLHYYKANYPRSGGASGAAGVPAIPTSWPKISCPVLVLHGRQDQALNARGHSNTWEAVDGEMTLVMFPDAGHFLQQEQPERVSRILRDWLAR